MKKLALFALMACAGASIAQPVPVGWVQPWTPDLPGFESRVLSCSQPFASNLIALDDFGFNANFTFTQINWWGTLTPTTSSQRPRFFLAIYKDANCLPSNSMVWRACVPVRYQQVGVDCTGKPVYKFFTNHLPTTLPAGHYWLQISEDDSASPQPGLIDFEWSAHDPIVKCPAVQMDAWGNIFQPLVEWCYGRKVDLAFEVL